MKTLLAGLVLSVISLGAYAQGKVTINTKQTNTTTQHHPAPVAAYKCPVCGATSPFATDCKKDKVTMVKVGDYYCPDCYMTSSKAGKCTMCGVDMKKMEAPATK